MRMSRRRMAGRWRAAGCLTVAVSPKDISRRHLRPSPFLKSLMPSCCGSFLSVSTLVHHSFIHSFTHSANTQPPRGELVCGHGLKHSLSNTDGGPTPVLGTVPAVREMALSSFPSLYTKAACPFQCDRESVLASNVRICVKGRDLPLDFASMQC